MGKIFLLNCSLLFLFFYHHLACSGFLHQMISDFCELKKQHVSTILGQKKIISLRITKSESAQSKLSKKNYLFIHNQQLQK